MKKFVVNEDEMWNRVNILLQKGYDEAVEALKEEAKKTDNPNVILYVANKLFILGFTNPN